MAARVVRINAQEVCQTRICIAMHCGDDAEPSGYCRRHERSRRMGIEVPLHRVTQPRAPNHDAELWCNACQSWLPDDDFPISRHKSSSQSRRYRHPECRACSAKRRVRQRQNRTPEERQRQLEVDRARKRRRAQKNGTP